MSRPIELTDLKARRSPPPSYPPPPGRRTAPAPAPASSGNGDAPHGTGALGKAYRLAEEKAKAAVHLQEGGMDSLSTWGCGAAIWYTTLSLPLLLFPRILLFFSQVAPPSNPLSASSAGVIDRDHYDVLTPLESFLARALGAGLVSMALMILFALIPRFEPPNTNPARKPLMNVLVGLSTLMAVVAYNTRTIGALGTVTGVGNGVVAIWGWFVIVFGGNRLVQRDSKVPKRLRKL